MDAVSELLADVRARGAVFGQAILRPPWALRMASGAPLTLATPLTGHAWIVPDEHEPVRVETGEAVLLTGAFERQGELSERLLQALPPALVVPATFPSVDTVAEEIARDRPGQQQVLDRLLDLMLGSALRSWFDNPDANAPAWCRALDDPIVGTALRLMHDAPAAPWTVENLATKVGVSRAALARRFTAQVGEPPMAYLASWRMALAADLLRQTDDTVATIARKGGYANAFALSVAFKRLRGTRPSDYRTAGTSCSKIGRAHV